MVPRVNDSIPLARKRTFHWISIRRNLPIRRKTIQPINLTNSHRRYMAEILPILRKIINQTMKHAFQVFVTPTEYSIPRFLKL